LIASLKNGSTVDIPAEELKSSLENLSCSIDLVSPPMRLIVSLKWLSKKTSSWTLCTTPDSWKTPKWFWTWKMTPNVSSQQTSFTSGKDLTMA
jgi:hypothetical protein